jgi:hypothetical protein
VIVAGAGRPSSRTPNGEGTHPAEHWARELEKTNEERELERVVRGLRAELDAVRRRPVPDAIHVETAADMAALVVERGEGFSPREISVAVRATPSFVRRSRVAAGRHPETAPSSSSTGARVASTGASSSSRSAACRSGRRHSSRRCRSRRCTTPHGAPGSDCLLDALRFATTF